MLAACMAHYASRRRQFGQAADSHSCRDQGKTRGDSARDLSQTTRSQDGPGIIPTFSNPRVRQGAARSQVISLGNIKWAQELLRPASEISQPETTTTQQQHNTVIPQAGTLADGVDPPDQEEEAEEPGPRSGSAVASSTAAALEEDEALLLHPAGEQQQHLGARSPSSSRLSGSSSSGGVQSRRKSESGGRPGGPHERVQADEAQPQLPSVPPSRPPLEYHPHRYDIV